MMAGCGYVEFAKTPLTRSIASPLGPIITAPGAQFVSMARVNAPTAGAYTVTSELGVSTGTVFTTSGGYTVYQSVQAASYVP